MNKVIFIALALSCLFGGATFASNAHQDAATDNAVLNGDEFVTGDTMNVDAQSNLSEQDSQYFLGKIGEKIKGAFSKLLAFFKGLFSKYKPIFQAKPGTKMPTGSGPSKSTEIILAPITPAQQKMFKSFCEEIMAKYASRKEMALALHPDKVCGGEAELDKCVSEASPVFTRANECY